MSSASALDLRPVQGLPSSNMIIGGIGRGIAVAVVAVFVVLLFQFGAVNSPNARPLGPCPETSADPTGLRLPCFR